MIPNVIYQNQSSVKLHLTFVFVLGFLKDNMHEHNSHSRRTTNVYYPSTAELNPICNMLALLDHHVLHVGRVQVKVTDSSQSRHIEYA